jgi:NDP-sugar pyrophosphorylase family protein
MTGGRVKRVLPYIKDETFLLTYGDGVTDSDINATIKYHKKQKRILTMTAVQPPGRFGDLEIADGKVVAFREKPERQTGFINGGYFVVNRSIGRYLGDDTCVFEQEPMAGLAAAKSWARMSIVVSGSAWTRSGSSNCWPTSGTAAKRRGKSGDVRWLLPKPPRPRDGPHRFQGRVARALA